MMIKAFSIIFLVIFPIATLGADAKPPTTAVSELAPYTERVPGTVVKFDMIPIPAAKIAFALDPKDVPRGIQIKRFWIAKTECTWDEYDTFFFQLDVPRNERQFRAGAAGKTRPTMPWQAPDCGFGHSGYPVICVTAHAGKMYCQWLSEKTGRKYRLPTPAEWEYACRAGGKELKATDEAAWTKENSEEQTHPVAEKKFNAFRLYDMLGNAGEWTITDDGKTELLCGGHFLLQAKAITSATREAWNPAWVGARNAAPNPWWLADGPLAGFRVVREEQ